MGSACHLNLNEHLTEAHYRKILDITANIGCSYFTFNIPNTICNECGHISKHRETQCPNCESTNIDWLTRVIGYVKRVSAWSEARQKEEKRRHYHEEYE